MKIEAIIFDLDNTLYDFSDIWLRAFKKMYYYYGLNNITEYDYFFKTFKHYDKQILDEIKAGKLRIIDLRNTRIKRTMSKFGIHFSDCDAKMFYEKMFEYIIEFISSDNYLIKELKRLKNKIKLFILTNGIGREQYKKLDKLNIINFFDKIYISSETDINKPDLRAFMQILSENKLDFKTTLMIGDSIYHDIIPAYKLGLKTCYIKKEWHLTNYTQSSFNSYDYEDVNILNVLKKIKS